MIPAGRCSGCPMMIYRIILLLGLFCGCCSPRNNEPKEDQTPASTSSQVQAEPLDSQELEELRHENNDLKKTIAEALPFLDEVKKLRSENETLQKAVSEISALKERLERLAKENRALKLVMASAEVSGKARPGATQAKQPGTEGYRKYSEESQKKAAALLVKYESADGVKAKLELLESLRDSASKQDPSIIHVVRRAMEDPNTKVARAAIDLLADYDTPEALPAIEQALKLGDEQIRAAAVEPLSAISDPQVIPLLTQALNDASADVRAAAMEAVQQNESDPIKLSILEKAMASPYSDVKHEAVSMLSDRSDHTAVDLLVEGMKDQDPKIREEVSDTLSFLVDQEFKTYQEAQAWWARNKDKYDADLIRIDDETEGAFPSQDKKPK